MNRKRCRRFDDPGHAHSLTFSCYQRLLLLSRDRTRRWLVESIEEARRLTQFELWAYVIMPEHAHVLLVPRPEHSGISQILWRIKRPVARKAIAFLRETSSAWLDRLTVIGPAGTRESRFWQAGGGHDRNIIEPKTAWRIVEYLHLNPVRRGLVEKPEDWEWSSAGWYAGIRPVHLEMDPTLPRTYSV
jgi:putative transposase